MKKIIASFAFSAIILSGCTKNDDTNIQPVEQRGLELSAIIPETRTYLGDAGSDGKTQVLWSDGDKLTVWSDEKTSPLIYVLSEGANTTTAVFNYTPTVSAPQGIIGNEYYAIYPQSTKTTVSGNEGYIELPNSQECVSPDKTANFEPTYNPMAAVGSELNNMVFHNLCGILVVDVTPDQDLNLTKIILDTEGSQALCGPATISFPAAGGVPTLKATDASKNQLTLACKNMTLTGGKKYSFYIVVPAGTYENMSVKIYTNKKFGEPTLYKVRANRPIEITTSAITTIGANFNLTTIEPEPLHQYTIGEKYPYSKDGSAAAEGVVFALDNAEGTAGRIFALEDCPGTYKWTNNPNDVNVATSNQNNGLLNMESVINANIDNFPAFKVCHEISTGNLTWYLPALNELLAITNNYSALESAWREIANKSTTDYLLDGNYYTSTTKGTRPTNRSLYYYSVDDDEMINVKFTSADFENDYKVRAVAQFNQE